MTRSSMADRPVDLNAARKLHQGRADDGRCRNCREYRIVCRLTDCGGSNG